MSHFNHSSYPTALITGASRGIGRAIAESFAGAGYALILTCSKTIDDLNTFAAQLSEKYGTPCLAVQADMGNAQDVARLFSEINHLDVLVNNAGISYPICLQKTGTRSWQ